MNVAAGGPLQQSLAGNAQAARGGDFLQRIHAFAAGSGYPAG